MKRLIGMAAVILLGGCTSFRVHQVDESPGERVITSDIKAVAWFSSSQALAKIKALQTDRSQSFGSDLVQQQGATNTIAALQNIVRILELVRPTP